MKILTIFCALFSSVLYSYADVVYGQLVVPEDGTPSETVSVETGETFEILSRGQFVDGGFVHFAALEQPQPVEFELQYSAYYGKSSSDPVLVGPCTVYFTGSSRRSFVMYKISSPNASMTSSVVTLSSTSTGWDVQLETSTDLKNWTAVPPGSFSGDLDLQFFRVKAVQIEPLP